MVSRYLPMLARSAPAPFSGDDWLFEVKWDGVRAIATVDGTLSLMSRNGTELAGRFPELGELLTLAPRTVLDGEIVVMTGGKPDMQALLPRLQSDRPGTPPATYIVFDILERDKKTLTGLPLEERRTQLEAAVGEGAHVVISEPVAGRGEDYYRAAVAAGLEGVMAKRRDSLYETGVRSGMWLKIKAQKTCDCVIAGYTPGRGGPENHVRGAPFRAVREQGACFCRKGRDRLFRPAPAGTRCAVRTACNRGPTAVGHPRKSGLAGTGPCLRSGVPGGDPGPETAHPPFSPSPFRQAGVVLYDRPDRRRGAPGTTVRCSTRGRGPVYKTGTGEVS